MPPTRIHLLRHGQGHHQLPPTSQNRLLPDPALTPAGITKCKSFHDRIFPHDRLALSLLCASPMRRAIQTAALCFPSPAPRPIVLLPDAQEATALPSDTGRARGEIEAEFGEAVDAGLVGEGWNSNEGEYAETKEALGERARRLREWFWGCGEGEVGVVGHGMFWHWVTGEVDERGEQTSEFSLFLYFFFLCEGDGNREAVLTWVLSAPLGEYGVADLYA